MRPALIGLAHAFALVVTAAAALPSFAQSPKRSELPDALLKDDAAEIESSEDTISLLDQLSKGRYSSRQQATLRMWGSRDELRDQVQRAARDSNPEVSGRAKWILDQWRRGTSPGMPPRVMRLLQKGDDPAAIVELIELGRFADAVVAVQESAQSIEFERIKQKVTNAFTMRFPFYIEHAMQDDSLPDLLRLIDLSAANKEMAVCRVRLMDAMGIKIDDDALLPSAAAQWVPALQDEAMVAIVMVRGEQDKAIELAKESSNDNLIRIGLMLGGRWQELADRSIKKTSLVDGDTSEKSSDQSMSLSEITRWVHVLVAADRCSDESKASQAIGVLSKVPSEQEGFGLAWKSLALHGQMELVLKMLDRKHPNELVDVALAASRPEAIFEKLNFRLSDLDSELHLWIDETIDKQLADIALLQQPAGGQGENRRGNQPAIGRRNIRDQVNPDVPNEAIIQLMGLMKCLLAVGRDDAAWEIAERLANEPLQFGPSRDPRPLRDYVVQNLLSTSRSEWVFQLVVAEDAKTVSATAQWCAARLLDDTESMTLRSMTDALKRLYRQASFPERFSMACDLLRGDMPQGFEPDRDFERLYEALNSRASVGFLNSRMPPLDRSQINHDYVKFFARHGQTELATKCLSDLARKGDLDAFYELALYEASSGNVQRADQFFDLTWKRARANGQSPGLKRFREADAIAGMKSLVGRWMGAKHQGDNVLAADFRRQIDLTLCSPSTEFCDSIAEHLADLGAESMAKEVYEVLLPMTAMGSAEATEFYDVARKYSTMIREQDGEAAVRWFDLAVGGTLESTYFRSSAYVTLPIYIRRWALEAAIDRNDRVAVAEHLSRLNQLDPMDISFAEEQLPKMRTAGMTELADKVFDELFERGKTHLKRFPMDVTVGNNVAWVAAMNDRRLDDAVELSERTVFLEPDSAIYRDTLAEILFRLGRKKEALHIEESCLLDDPTQWHLYEQVSKYRDALANESVQLPR
ncbi:hypothetical protein K239x_51160 [Planctomycetes bacterium K23_9]|uniref:Tetratricopeptide repeat protein n=2 Tax=Stieleria marina TaxID=1930275 RepID=A0A517P147_9BACT|nr:hypothetical protein K239x_51160 [Planctomycetes bacterium K23_9]